jgi:hypothetical protein
MGAPDDSAIHIHNESALEQSEDPLSPADIAEATGMARNNPDKWAEDEPPIARWSIRAAGHGGSSRAPT